MNQKKHRPAQEDRGDLSKLVTESRNPKTVRIDAGTTQEVMDLILDEDEEILAAVRRVREPMAMAAEMIADALGEGGRLYYVGAGTSGRLGVLDAAECPPTFGTSPQQIQGIIAGGYRAMVRAVEGAEDRGDRGAEAMRRRGVGPADVVFGITASGSTPFVIRALEAACQRGARTILLAFNPCPPRPFIHLVISPVVGPEVITGSTRMKAGTATKLVLNTISTAAMVRLGKVYGNLMVDLRMTSHKLRDRARRIVSEIAQVGPERAQVLLDGAGGDVKVAIVMHRRNVSSRKARDLLRAHRGVLRPVLEGDSPWTLRPSLRKRGRS